jgi:hypothetical protein
MKIYFTIPFLPFSYSIKILFLYNIQVPNLSLLFHKISAQSPIKDKNMKEGREKKNVYTKIMYKKPLLVPYILENTVESLEGWLNVGNLM